MRELDISTASPRQMMDAFDLASDQDEGTWLTDGGRRIAAIVPVDVAEDAQRINAILVAPIGAPVLVYSPDAGQTSHVPLFTGRMAGSSPWAGHHLVLADGPIDLPPMYPVELIRPARASKVH